MKSDKFYIINIQQKKLIKRMQQHNEFNKVMKQNGYYIH